MIIRNITSGQKRQNIILSSLKEKRDEEDITIRPGEFIDTDVYCISDRKIEKSNELKQWVKDGCIKILKSIDEDEQDIKKLKEESLIQQREMILDRIAGTNGLTELDDYIKNSKDHGIIEAARNRLQELTGNSDINNPEVENKNPLL